jgi:hypothetical protein
MPSFIFEIDRISHHFEIADPGLFTKTYGYDVHIFKEAQIKYTGSTE